jgi:hypothetical protein
MSGAPASGPYHPGFKGLNMMNGPAGPPSGMFLRNSLCCELCNIICCIT